MKWRRIILAFGLLATLAFGDPALIVTGPLRKQSGAVTFTPSGLVYFPSGGTIDLPTLENPLVDGVVIGQTWSDLEPIQGTYVFNSAAHGQSLDSMIASVELADSQSRAAGGPGKWARLSIITGGPGVSAGGAKPDWLVNTAIPADAFAGGKFITYYADNAHTTTATIPVFWEPTLLARHGLLAAAVGAHLASHPVIKGSLVAYANANTNDWNLGDISPIADGLPPAGSSPRSRWLTTLTGSGYASMDVALTAAGNQTFAAYRSGMPANYFLTTPIGRLDDSTLNAGWTSTNRGNQVAAGVVNTAAAAVAPGLVIAQKQSLNALGTPTAPGGTSTWNDLYQLAVPHAAQMVWHAYNDCQISTDPLYLDQWAGSRMSNGVNGLCDDSVKILKDAIDIGITYGTLWQEIYEIDIQNLSLPTNADPHIPIGYPGNGGTDPDVITYAHNKLLRGP
jgi:hypothetical protein